jgi:hypothetical protein
MEKHVRNGEVLSPDAEAYPPGMLDIETIDSELRLVAPLRGAARERGGPLPSIDVPDALLDERNRGAVPPRRYG